MKFRRVAVVIALSISGVFVASLASAVNSPLSQYAATAIASTTYSQTGTGDYAADAATGAPNQSACGDSGTSWASASGTQDGETLTVTFTKPVVPTQIKIWMVIEPRSLVKVEVANGAGTWTTVLNRAVSTPLLTGASCSSMSPGAPIPHTLNAFNATLPHSLVNKIKMTFNEATAGGGWAGEVDAVQMTGNNPANTVASSITGTAKVGKVLSAAKGTWVGSPTTITYAYAWYVCTSSGAKSSTLPTGCTPISGATGSTRTLTSAQLNKYIRVRVAATNTTSTTYLYSATTAKVVN